MARQPSTSVPAALRTNRGLFVAKAIVQRLTRADRGRSGPFAEHRRREPTSESGEPARADRRRPFHSVAAGEFKAKCLEILDRVARDGSAYVVTKRGRPVAKVIPVEAARPTRIRGSVRYLGDIVGPIGDELPARAPAP
jgi:prevent-host-death family protein